MHLSLWMFPVDRARENLMQNTVRIWKNMSLYHKDNDYEEKVKHFAFTFYLIRETLDIRKKHGFW